MPARRRLRRNRTFTARSGGGTVTGTSRLRVSHGVRDYPIWAPHVPTRQEMKFVDVNGANYAADTTGTIILLNRIDPGDDINGREGQRVRMLGTIIKGSIEAGSAGTHALATLLIVMDKQPQPTGAAVLPAITDILETVFPTSFTNVVGRERFLILARYDYCLTGNTTTPSTGREFFTIQEKLDYNFPAAWISNSGQIGGFGSGALYAVTLGNVAASMTLAPIFSLTYRSLFADV